MRPHRGASDDPGALPKNRPLCPGPGLHHPAAHVPSRPRASMFPDPTRPAAAALQQTRNTRVSGIARGERDGGTRPNCPGVSRDWSALLDVMPPPAKLTHVLLAQVAEHLLPPCELPKRNSVSIDALPLSRSMETMPLGTSLSARALQRSLFFHQSDHPISWLIPDASIPEMIESVGGFAIRLR